MFYVTTKPKHFCIKSIVKHFKVSGIDMRQTIPLTIFGNNKGVYKMIRSFIITVLFITITSIAEEPVYKEWDGTGTITIENNGKGGGVRFTLPVESFPIDKTLKFNIISGEFKNITINVETKEGDTFKPLLVTDTTQLTVSEENMKRLETWKKNTKHNIFTHYVFTANGDVNRIDSYPLKISASFVKREKNVKGSIGYTLLSFYQLAYIGFMILTFLSLKSKNKSMLHDKTITNNEIVKHHWSKSGMMMLASLLLAIIPPAVIAMLFSLPSNSVNSMGGLMIGAPIFWLWYFLTGSGHPNKNRCPKCHHYGGIAIAGTRNHTIHTTTKYVDGIAKDQDRTETFVEARQCPECSHTWEGVNSK